jgi:DNA-binding ferritin-like protein
MKERVTQMNELIDNLVERLKSLKEDVNRHLASYDDDRSVVEEMRLKESLKDLFKKQIDEIARIEHDVPLLVGSLEKAIAEILTGVGELKESIKRRQDS